MSTPPDWVTTQADPLLGLGKRVLAVEGIRDAQIYGFWLAKLAAPGTLAEDKVVLVTTEGKSALINGLKWYRNEGGDPPDVYGLRDRDEWDAPRIASEVASLPQLRVNVHRHCLESYFCDPDEIQASLLAHDAARFTPHLASLQADILAPLADWADHWSLWTTTNRLNAEMRGARFPHLFHHQYMLPADAEIKKRLADWAAIVEPASTFADFDALRTATRLRPATERFRSCVFARAFSRLSYGRKR